MILFKFDDAIDYVVESLSEIKGFIESISDFIPSLFDIFPAPFGKMLAVCFSIIFLIALYKILTKKGWFYVRNIIQIYRFSIYTDWFFIQFKDSVRWNWGRHSRYDKHRWFCLYYSNYRMLYKFRIWNYNSL